MEGRSAAVKKARRQVFGAAAVVFAMSAFASGNAMAEPRVPSDDELHSMYCVEVLKAEITLQQHMIDEASEAAGAAAPEQRAQWLDTSAELLQRLTKLQVVLYKLQVYMLPRIPTIDSVSLASAIRQADADVQSSSEGCAGECDDPAHAQSQQPQLRNASWNGAALQTRLRGCENPTWISL